MKYCPKCGKQNEYDAKFCLNCGNKFDVENVNIDTDNNQEDLNGSNYYNAEPQTNYIYNNKKSSLDKVSMVLGIIAIAFSTLLCCCSPISYILGPIAIILGIIYMKKCPNEKKGKATAGIILGAIALLFAIFFTVILPETIESMKEIAYLECQNNPNSDECITYKQSFPQWFQ